MNKKLLCTAVGATLAAVSGLTWATNDQLLPYVVKDANRTTVVTLIGEGAPVSEGAHLHLQYWTKSTTDANTAACQPSSVYVPFTDNDIMTFDTAGVLGYPLFGDTTNPAPLGTAISYPGPRHGYLAVVNELVEPYRNNLYRSYWLELDLSNGGAHGDAGQYREFRGRAGYESPWTALTPGLPFQQSKASGAPAAAVAFWPSSVAGSVFTVTPLGRDMVNQENSQVVVQVMNGNRVQGAYDRNENGIDGTVPITVRCVGRVTPAQLMPGVVTNAAWAAQGGWGFLANLGDNNGVIFNYSGSSVGSSAAGDDRAATVYQVDQSAAGGKFMSNAVRITSATGQDCDVGIRRRCRRR